MTTARNELLAAFQKYQKPGRKALGDTVQPDGTAVTKAFYEGNQYGRGVEQERLRLLRRKRHPWRKRRRAQLRERAGLRQTDWLFGALVVGVVVGILVGRIG